MRRPAFSILALIAALLGAVVSPGQPYASAQDATPAAAACTATTPAENREIVSQFLTAVSSQDDATAAALTAEEITFHSRSKGARTDSAENFLHGQRGSFPDAAMTIDLLVAEGDTVAAYVTWSGTLQGDTVTVSDQDVSIPEGQRDAEWVGSVFFQVDCGKIAEVWPIIDRLGHLMNLGVITEEDLQSADPVGTPQP